MLRSTFAPAVAAVLLSVAAVSSSAQVIYTPVQYQYGDVMRYYYGGNSAHQFAFVDRLACRNGYPSSMNDNYTSLRSTIGGISENPVILTDYTDPMRTGLTRTARAARRSDRRQRDHSRCDHHLARRHELPVQLDQPERVGGTHGERPGREPTPYPTEERCAQWDGWQSVLPARMVSITEDGNGLRHIQLSNGSRYYEGSVLRSGAELKRIDADGLVLSGGVPNNGKPAR